MVTNADVLHASELIRSRPNEITQPRAGSIHSPDEWNPEGFAHQQIRGLVQRIFFAGGSVTVRQVAFAGTGPDIDVAYVCDLVGRALALESRGDVAIVCPASGMGEAERCSAENLRNAGVKERSARLMVNLWRVASVGKKSGEEPGTTAHWLPWLAELRSDFEYCVIQAAEAGTSSEAALLGQLTDGIILVLGAHSTRKAVARKIKETLESSQSRILGTVLIDRRFPVPERIYRRL